MPDTTPNVPAPTSTDSPELQVWPLDRILREVAVGSRDWSWEEEWADLDKRHAETGYLVKLEQQIRENGITMPVLIGSDGRLWDGHHRLRLAVTLGIGYVPVEIVQPTPETGPDSEMTAADARDALAFVAEKCDTADREGTPLTTASVREWLKGPPPGCRVSFPPPSDDPQSTAAVQPDVDELANLRTEYERVRLMLRASREVRRTAQQGVTEREALLTEARDLLEDAGDTGADGDDWPQIAPAIQRLISRTEQAEADVKKWLAFIERGMDTHMSFGVINPDGTTEQLPCADWCYACRLEHAEAEAERLGAQYTEAMSGASKLSHLLDAAREYAGQLDRFADTALKVTDRELYAAIAKGLRAALTPPASEESDR